MFQKMSEPWRPPVIATTNRSQVRLDRIPPTHWRVIFNNPPLTRMGAAAAAAFAVEIAERKAYTSALVGMRTADLLPMVQPGQPLYSVSTVAGGKFCAMSGGTVENDVGILEAALKQARRRAPVGRNWANTLAPADETKRGGALSPWARHPTPTQTRLQRSSKRLLLCAS
jgi:hypothetical protein